jgi:hypothetical protein
VLKAIATAGVAPGLGKGWGEGPEPLGEDNCFPTLGPLPRLSIPADLTPLNSTRTSPLHAPPLDAPSQCRLSANRGGVLDPVHYISLGKLVAGAESAFPL